MGKRFEGSEPTFLDMIAAFQALGLVETLGTPGEVTAYAARYPMGECVEFSVLPGTFTAKEVEELRAWAA